MADPRPSLDEIFKDYSAPAPKRPSLDEIFAPVVNNAAEAPPTTTPAPADDFSAKTAQQRQDTIDRTSTPKVALASLGQGIAGIGDAVLATPETVSRLSGALVNTLDRADESTPIGLVNKYLIKPVGKPALQATQYAADTLATGRLGGGEDATQLFTGTSESLRRVQGQRDRQQEKSDTFKAVQYLNENADDAFKRVFSGEFQPVGQVITDPKSWASFIANAAPSLVAAYMTGGSIPFIAWLEGMEGASNAREFEEATGQKMTDEQFATSVAQVAAINGTLEKYSIDKILNTKGLKDILTSAVSEGTTEGLQALNTNLAQYWYSPEVDVTRGILPGILGGAGSGAAVSGAQYGLDRMSASPDATVPPPGTNEQASPGAQPQQPAPEPAPAAATSQPQSVPPTGRQTLSDMLENEAPAAQMQADMEQQAAAARQVQVGDVIRQGMIEGTVDEVFQVGDNTFYSIRVPGSENPVFIYPEYGEVSIKGQAAPTPPPATMPETPTRADLAQAVAPVPAPEASAAPPVAPTTPTFKDRLPTMSQDELVSAYQGNSASQRRLAQQELESRFPGWNAPKALDVVAAASEVNTAPTEAQKEAGNYKMGHVSIDGLDISIENPQGSVRSGVAPDGTPWNVEMPAHYGYIRRTEGADGDHLDVYIGPNMASDRVWVVDQIDPATGQFDETKAFVGFSSAEEVQQTYQRAFSDGSASSRMGSLSEIPMASFKEWARSDASKQAYSYKPPVPEARIEDMDIPALEQRLQTLMSQARNTGWNRVMADQRSRLEEAIAMRRQAELEPAPETAVASQEQTAQPPVQPQPTPAVETTPEVAPQPESPSLPPPEAPAPTATPEPAEAVPPSPAQEDSPQPETPQESATETPGADAQAATETTPPRKRMKDVGEQMAGKRAERKPRFNELAGGEAAREIIKQTSKVKVWVKPVDDATSGTKRYNQVLYDGLPAFSAVFKARMGISNRRLRRSGQGWEEQLRAYFDPTSGLTEQAQRVRELADEYINTVETFSEAMSGAKTVQEAKQALLDIAVQDGTMEMSDYPLTNFGDKLADLYHEGAKFSRYNFIRSAVSKWGHPGNLSDEAQVKPRQTVEKKLVRPSLERIDREGLKDYRNGKDVDAQTFMDTFGFRGVEFGEWVRAAEGQAHVNHAYDAFMDLADRLGVPPKAMSLGGKLGFAFGSRGHSEHAAHYEPGTKVINLTKTKGDGSVAHEWSHALDYALRGTDAGKKAISGMYTALRQEQTELTQLEEHIRQFLIGRRYYEGMRRQGTVAMAKYYLERLIASPQNFIANRTPQTQFKRDGDALGKNYWGTDVELFARGWESFIYDTLPGQSPYLVSNWVADGNVDSKNGYRGRPYPTGAERANFNEVWQEFIDGIDFTADGGPRIKDGYVPRAEAAAQRVKAAAEDMLKKLPDMAKEVEDEQRRIQRPTVQGGVSQGDGGARPANVPGTQGDADAGRATGRSDGAGGADVSGDVGAVQEGQPTGGQGSGERGDGSGVRGDDSVPGKADAAYATEAVGDLPAVQGDGVNHVIQVGALDEKRSQRVKARDNLRIIRLVKDLEREGRPANADEQVLLAKYTGWGSLRDAFPNPKGEYKEGWGEIGRELKGLLTEEEYRTSLRTIQYAHYTSEVVVRSMWSAMERLGFKGGNVFEPGMGIGNFVGMMPSTVSGQTTYSGLEVDPMTARVARLLYPQSSVRAADFAQTVYPDGMFDAAIGNPPFADIKVKSDPKYSKEAFSLHNYFFAKTLDMLAPGGVMAFITSRYTMDGADSSARAWMYEKADLLGAIRLPNTAFKTNANTEVVSDILFLRKRLPGEEKGDGGWVNTGTATYRGENGTEVDIGINSYFIRNPEMVLGNPALRRSQFRENDYTVDPVESRQLSAQLAEAVQRLPEGVVTDTQRADTAGLDMAPTETKEGSYYLKEGALMQVNDGVGRPVAQRGRGVAGGLPKADMDKVKQLIPVRDALRDALGAMIDRDKARMEKAQKDLGKAYDAFVKKNGPIAKVEIEERRPGPAQMEGLRNDMRDDYAEAGMEFDEGDIDLSAMVDAKNPATGKKYTLYELAATRQQRREELEAQGKTVHEGSFNPDMQEAVVTERYPNLDVFKADPEYYNLMILENYDPATGTATKTPVFEKNIVAEVKKPTINTAVDALNYSLATTNRVDMDVMAREYGKDADAIAEELESQNIVYRVPSYNMSTGQLESVSYEVADAYLSGKVKMKLAAAEEWAKVDPAYRKNVEALKAVQPADIPVSEISTNLGSPYISSKVVEDFSKNVLGLTASIRHFSTGNIWSVSVYNRYSTENTHKWGTDRMEAGQILENLLSKRTIAIYDSALDVQGKETRVLNADATEAAKEKGKLIQEAFDDWIWKSEHGTAVHRQYNDTFNDVVPRKFDGSHLTPAISPDFKPFRHQKDFVWRVLQSGNAYAAHAVGAGKTGEIAMAVMEQRRLGTWKKPMVVVPNHMLAQFSAEFMIMYPQAKVLVADEYRFHTSRRQKFVAQVAKGDWDAVVITYAAFKKIPVSDSFEAGMVRAEIDRYIEAYRDAGGDPESLRNKNRRRRGDPTQLRLQRAIERLEEKLEKMKAKGRDQSFTFEQLGVDALAVDEAHTFRKLSFPTLQGNLRGVDPNGSKAAWDLYVKSRYLDTIHPGKNLILASGTPLTNTVGEVFTIQRLMDERQLVERGIDNFDAWSSTFATTVTNLEKQPSGKYANVTRLARFQNLQSLSMMVREFMDVVTSKELGTRVDRPNMKGGKIAIRTSQPTREFKSYQKHLEQRMEAIAARNGPPKPGDDIILKVIGDGRHAAIDMRLIDPTLPEQPSKLEDMIGNIFKIWQDTANNEYDTRKGSGKKSPAKGAAQIVFSDLGIKTRERDGKRFSAYSHMRRKLVDMGVPPDQIAFMRDYEKSDEKRRLFKRVRDGEVRILIGSTGNMGTGVNVQNRLYAIHNLDAPWLPADLEQRIGRGLRQGNQNAEIGVFGYGTEGSYDSTMWGILETKANAIQQFLSGETKINEMDDIEDTDTYRLAKALTSGDPRILEQAALQQEITVLERKARNFLNEQSILRQDISGSKQRAAYNMERADRLEKEVLPKRTPTAGDAFSMVVSGRPYTDRTAAGQAVLAVANQIATEGVTTPSDGVAIGEYGGFPLRLYYDAIRKVDTPFSLFVDAPFLTGEEYKWGNASVTRPFSPVGMSSRLTNVLDGVEAEIARSREVAAEAERDAKQMEAQLAPEFPQLSELRQKQEQLEKLEADLRDNAVQEVVDEVYPPEYWEQAAGKRGAKFSIATDTSDQFMVGYRSLKRNTFREEVEAKVAAHLKKVGWPDLKVILEPEIESPVPGRAISGLYWNSVVRLAMGRDIIKTLNHELVHALKEIGVFTAGEWRMLESQAARWREKYGIDATYKGLGLDEAALNEEAIARAFEDHSVKGAPRRIFNRILRFLQAVKESLTTGKWQFQTAEDVFDAILSGKVAKRRQKPVAERESRIRFSLEEKDPEKALDQAQSDIDRALSLQVKGFDRTIPDDLGGITNYILHPHNIASLHAEFAPVYKHAINQFQMRDRIVHDLTNYIEEYNRLKDASKEKVNAVLELGRLDGEGMYMPEATVSPRQIVVKNTGQPEAVFSKVGDTITLNEKEAEIYQNVRRGMDAALDMYIESVLEGYGLLEQGIDSRSKLEKAIVEEKSKTIKEKMALALKMVRDIEESKRRGYVPFKRYGDIGILVKDRTIDEESGANPVVYYTQVDTKGIVDRAARVAKRVTGREFRTIGSQPQVRQALEVLSKKYPSSQYDIITFPVSRAGDLEGKVSIRDLDVLAASSDLTQDEYADFRASIEDAMKRRGFRSHFFQARNVPGYTPDFERALNDYVIGISGFLARRRYAPKIDQAIQQLAAKKVKPRLLKYAKDYAAYIQNPQEEFQRGRQIVFMYYIAGNMASAITNLTQTPLVTAPWMSAMVGHTEVAKLLSTAAKDVAMMTSILTAGMDVFSPNKAPSDVKGALTTAWNSGQFIPLNTHEAMGVAQTSSSAMRGLSRHSRRAMDFIAIKFTAAERINRLVTFIANYRMASDPKNRAKIEKFLQNDAYAQETVIKGDDGTFAERFAEYAVYSTQLRMGRLNRPRLFRGAGTALFQFKSYVAQILELQYRLAVIHGPEGKKAFAYMLLALALSAGFWGLPGVEDLRDWFEKAYKTLTRRDIDVETETRLLVAELLGAKGAETWAAGFPRLLGVDMSGRLGFGDILPDTADDLYGVWYDFLVGRPERFFTDAGRGDYLKAMTELLPNFVGNFTKGLSWAAEGVQSQASGDTVITPESITKWDSILKMMGFTSARIANMREAEWAIKRADRSVNQLRSDYYDRLARSISRSARARNNGDGELADQYTQEFQAIMQEIERYNADQPLYKQIIVNQSALKRRIQQEMVGSSAKQPRKQARSRAEEIRSGFGVEAP